MIESNTHFWNSKESLSDYLNTKKELRDIESLMIMSALQQGERKVNETKILDLGCGGGRTTIPLNNLGSKIIGMDISKGLINGAQKDFPKIRWVLGDATNIPFTNETFDIVLFSFNGIDNLFPYEKRKKCLNEINRILKKEGFFIFS